MPTVTFHEQVIECQNGDNLRKVLLQAGSPLYNGIAKQIHCRGLGTCGTCSVEIEGQVSAMTRVEKWRLSFPPHELELGLRLACQCRVEGNLVLVKHPGMWGQRREASES